MNPIPSPPPVKVGIMLLLFLARLLPLITGFDRNHALKARAYPDTPVLSAFNISCKRVIQSIYEFMEGHTLHRAIEWTTKIKFPA